MFETETITVYLVWDPEDSHVTRARGAEPEGQTSEVVREIAAPADERPAAIAASKPTSNATRPSNRSAPTPSRRTRRIRWPERWNAARGRYFAELSAAVGAAWNRFWFTPRRATTLGVMRVLVGSMAFYTIATFAPDLDRWFGRPACCRST